METFIIDSISSLDKISLEKTERLSIIDLIGFPIINPNTKNLDIAITIGFDTIELFFRDKSKIKLAFRDEDKQSMVYRLPSLYGIDKKGKEREWKIWVQGSTCYKSYGETEGVKTISQRTFKGMNIGRSNETSPEEQAIREAERDWVDQLDKAYLPKDKKGIALSTRIQNAKTKLGGVSTNIATLIRNPNTKLKPVGGKNSGFKIDNFVSEYKPMCCQTWLDAPKCRKYFDFENGVYIQPKLDGVRALAVMTDSGVALVTRNSNQIGWLKHIRDDIAKIIEGTTYILDGEIYANAIYGEKLKAGKYRFSETEMDRSGLFDVISSAVRTVRKTPHELEDQLSFHVFDVIDTSDLTLNQDQRFAILDSLFDTVAEDAAVKRVETTEIFSDEEIKDYHDRVFQEGYEGVVIRSKDLTYESGKRSLKIRKYKYFEDAEYEIKGVQCDKGLDREYFTWVCVTEDGKEFRAKPKGSRDDRREMYDSWKKYKGKMLTVKYQQTTEDGVPRFPVAVAIRDYE